MRRRAPSREHHDLRSFLDRLERERQLLRVQVPIDPHLESTALSLRALREGGPALLMERPTGATHALLGNLFGHRRCIEMALAGRPLASLRELGQLLAAIKEPRWPSSLRQALSTWPELAQLAHVAPQRVREAAGIGSKLGIDATNKWPSETTRAWSQPIVPDAKVERRVDALWAALQTTRANR